MTRSTLFLWARIVVSIGLLVFVLYLTGLLSQQGRAAFVEQLTHADARWLLVSVLIGVLVNMVSAVKWHMLARAIGLQAGYWRIFSYYVIGQFYNLFLPTSVGGDVVRAYELGRFCGNQSASMASVFVERYTGILTLFVFAGFAFLFQLSTFNVDFVVISLIAFAIMLALIAWLVIDQRPYAWVKRFSVERFARLAPLFTKLDRLVLSVQSYREQRSALVIAFFNSAAFYLMAALNVLVSTWVFDISVTWQIALLATPIIMLIMNIPLSVGNIGLMEFAYASVFTLFGFDPALGLSVALLMRLKSVIDGLMGGLLQPFFVTRSTN